jgi:hypothetical protein
VECEQGTRDHIRTVLSFLITILMSIIFLLQTVGDQQGNKETIGENEYSGWLTEPAIASNGKLTIEVANAIVNCPFAEVLTDN